MVHFESKAQGRGTLKLAGQWFLGGRFWFGLALAALLTWLIFHYLIHPNWITVLPQFLSELIFLLEMASLLTLGILAIIGYLRTRKDSKVGQRATIEQLYALSPTEFERYVAALFRSKGYKVKIRGRKGDRGVDIELNRSDGRSAIVQCKRYRHTIGPDIVRELFGTMVHERVHHAFLVTTANISNAAREWAYTKPITLIDGQSLVQIANSLNNV